MTKQGAGLSSKRRRTCQTCGVIFETVQATARYCSAACRPAARGFGRSYGQIDGSHKLKVWRS